MAQRFASYTSIYRVRRPSRFARPHWLSTPLDNLPPEITIYEPLKNEVEFWFTEKEETDKSKGKMKMFFVARNQAQHVVTFAKS